MKNKGLKILIVINIVLFLVDIITTLRLGILVQYLEINPVYKYIGIPGLIILNLLMLGSYYWLYNKWSIPIWRYLTLFTLVAVAITRVMVIPTNIEVGNDPPTLEEAKAIPSSAKAEEAVRRLIIPNFLPFFNGIIAFLFFNMDHTIRSKDGL